MSSFSSSSALSFDVYLSFRGQDTRKTIVSHLHKELVNKGIYTLKDDQGIQMGDTISESLIRALENSKVVVVVISENYATSKWCLDELLLIMRLREEKKIEVIPLFYGVDPADVRRHRGNFDLQCHGDHEKIPMWREALTRIGQLHGISSDYCESEGKVVEDIGELISRKLVSMSSIDDLGRHDIAGMEEYMDSLNATWQMVMTKLRETAKSLGQQLREEQAARLEAEAKATKELEKSNDEIRRLKENLEIAEIETKELKKKLETFINM